MFFLDKIRGGKGFNPILSNTKKQAKKLKSCKMKEGWMKNDEGGWFQAVEGFCRLTLS